MVKKYSIIKSMPFFGNQNNSSLNSIGQKIWQPLTKLLGFINKLVKKSISRNKSVQPNRIVAIIVFLIFLIYLFRSLPHTLVAAWWDQSWLYRKPITLTNNSSQATYQVLVVVDTASLISAGKMQPKCTDLRFTDDATTPNTLNYWIEWGCGDYQGTANASGSTKTLVWVSYTNLPVGTTTIYMYYGNALATSTSSFSSLPTGIDIGNGADGACSVSSGTTTLDSGTCSGKTGGQYDAFATYATASTDSAHLTVNSLGASNNQFAQGDEIIIDVMVGASSSYTADEGKWETTRINYVDTTNKVFTLNHNLVNTYDFTNYSIMVQRIPNYTTLTMTGGTLTMSSWNGTNKTGGVLFFRSNSGITINSGATIKVDSLGFSGGGAGTGGAAGSAGAGGTSGTGGTQRAAGGCVVANNGGAGGAAGSGDGGAGGNGGGNSGNNCHGGAGGAGGANGGVAPTGSAGSAGTAPYSGATAAPNGGGGSNASSATGGIFTKFLLAGGGGGGRGGTGGDAGGGGGGGGGAGGVTTAPGPSGLPGTAGTPGVAGPSGGAGGLGGGSVMIFGSTVTINSGGSITAKGAAGTNGSNGTAGVAGGPGGNGAAAATGAGGGGGGGGGKGGKGAGGGHGAGGGGGGIIAIYSPDAVSIASADGTGGTAGLGGTPGAAGAGGGGGTRSNTGITPRPSAGSTGPTGNPAPTAIAATVGSTGQIVLGYGVPTPAGTYNPASSQTAFPIAGAPSTEENNTPTATPASYPTSSLQPPIAYWKFDEGYGTNTTDSINKLSGTLSGSTLPTWQTEDMCLSGKCMYYDGSTSHTVVNDPGTGSVLDFTTGDSITLSAWVKPNTLPGANTWATVVGKGDVDGTDDANYELQYGNNGTNNVITFCFIQNGTTTWRCYNAVNNNLQTNNWQHLTATFTFGTGSSIKLYYNGILQSGTWSSGTGSEDPTVTNKALWIGADNYAGGGAVDEAVNGFIDDVKVYRYARSADQIKADYNAKGAATAKGNAAIFGAQTMDALNKGLVGYWKMEESFTGAPGEVVDSSGNGNGGTTSGAYSTTGKFGQGAAFAAPDNTIDVGNGNSLNNLANWTYSFWVYPTNFDPGYSPRILCKSSTCVQDGNGPAIGITQTSGTLEVNEGVNGADAFSQTSTSLSLNTWNHVVAVYDSTNRYTKIYFNGIEQAYSSHVQGASETISDDSAQSLIIGNRTGADMGLAGRMDDVRIYNRALSPAEVQQLYNFAPGPVGYWKMDDKVDTDNEVINDSSGNNYEIISQNSPPYAWVNGKYGSAIYLDGTDDNLCYDGDPDGTCDPNTGLQISGDLTFETWLKPQTTDATTVIGQIVYEGLYSAPIQANNTLFSLAWDKTYAGNTLLYTHKYGSDTTVSHNFDYPLTAGQWYHLAIARDTTAKTVKLYVNGIYQETYSYSNNPDGGSAGIFRLGSIGNDATDNHLGGAFDDVRVYNYARTPGQIVQDMNGGHPAPGSPVGSAIAYHKYDECQGTVAHDSSPNGEDGDVGSSVSVWRSDGKFGCAFKAFIHSEVEEVDNLGDVSWIDGIAGMTISFWINPDSLGTNNVIIGKSQDGGGNNSFQIRTNGSSSSNIDVCIAANTGDYCGNYFTTSGLGLKARTWQHIVIIYDGTQAAANRVAVYKNATAVSGSVTGTLPTAMTSGTTLPLHIGGQGGGSLITQLPASYDEVKFFTFPLTSDQVKVEYNHGSAVTLGSFSNTSGLTGGTVASNSAGAMFCVPGDTTSCAFPYHWWPLDENQGQYVNDLGSGPNNNGGSCLGVDCSAGTDEPFWVPGKIGSALKFDGVDDYVETAQNPGLDGLSAYTVEAWIRRRVAGSYVTLGDQSGDCSAGITIEVFPGGTISSAIGAGTGCVGGAFASNDTSWHHVAFVFDGAKTGDANRLIGYLDGVQKTLTFAFHNGASQVPSSLSDGSDSWEIGLCAGGCSGEWTDGWIDDVRIYNYARTPAQIAWDMNRGAPQTWWKFDECMGTTAHDSIATVSGTLNGGTPGNCSTSSTAWYDGKTGKFNYSLKFGSSPDLTTVTSTNTYPFALAGSPPASWGGWFFPTSSINDQAFIDKKGQFRLYTNSSGNTICGVASAAGSYTDASSVTALITLNSWNHVICTYDGTTTLKTYVNGILKNTSNISKNMFLTTTTLYLGQLNDGTKQFTGQADSIKIWSYPLTLQQILLDYNQGGAVRFGPATGAP